LKLEKKNLTFKAREDPSRTARKLEPTQQEKHIRAATNPDSLIQTDIEQSINQGEYKPNVKSQNAVEGQRLRKP
jgi:hypothetical protein